MLWAGHARIGRRKHPGTTSTRLLQEDVDWASVHAWVADEIGAPDHVDNVMRLTCDMLLD